MLYMLDTDMASYLIKGQSPALEDKLLTLLPSTICVSVMTRAELLYGLKRLPREHRLHLAVSKFMKTVQVLAWGAEAADWYASIRHQLTNVGQPIGELDMMIAAHAIAANAVLVTNNTRHFGRIEAPLVLENWS